ncbi:unnamed protein product [Parnassius mnemosyne]|uniref:Uncharacterized protein n=1 Tax=Parnassius mnemosyne TaxID=213953 RepID=A0AAV1LYG7_9NEOP
MYQNGKMMCTKQDCKHTQLRLLDKLNDDHVIPNEVKKLSSIHWISNVLKRTFSLKIFKCKQQRRNYMFTL